MTQDQNHDGEGEIDGQFIIQFEGEDYNIKAFLGSHPAGRAVLLPFRNRDLTKKFYEVGHSNEAKKILLKHKINKSAADLELLTGKDSKFQNIKTDYVLRKLFTPEDEYLIHKSLGVMALVSFVYRYFYVLPRTGSLGFTGSALDWATLALHFLLSASSLIFHVIKTRMASRPLIIYEEYRQHAIVFTGRACLVSLLGMACQGMDTMTRRWLLGGTILACHLVVDWITSRHGTVGVTAVRNDGALSFKYLGLFYSFYQICALAAHLTWNTSLGDLGFNTLIAIQSSAFLMTLKRKSLIRWYTHAFWYSLALALSYYVMWSINGWQFFLYPALLFFFRVKFGVNKYILWATYTVSMYWFGLAQQA